MLNKSSEIKDLNIIAANEGLKKILLRKYKLRTKDGNHFSLISSKTTYVFYVSDAPYRLNAVINLTRLKVEFPHITWTDFDRNEVFGFKPIEALIAAREVINYLIRYEEISNSNVW